MINTPWKKSRKFGDIHGGRSRLRLKDNIFARTHSLKRPNPNEQLPILIEDNPSRDFFFPISADEAQIAIEALPGNVHQGITHIWLRRFRKSDFEAGNLPLAQFVCGSGVRAIILYPFPNSMIMDFGPKKPSSRRLKEFERWSSPLAKKNGKWTLKWSLDNLREYYVSNLLYHEVGHHIDWYYRHWSAANNKQAEEFADQYAIQHTAIGTEVIDNLRTVSNE